MFKKTYAMGGLMLATAAGALLSSQPASAMPADGCCNIHRFRAAHHSANWNGSRTFNRNHIRLRLLNRNNNVAVARTRQRQEGCGEAFQAPRRPLAGAGGIAERAELARRECIRRDGNRF